jgi:hypothetical protein
LGDTTSTRSVKETYATPMVRSFARPHSVSDTLYGVFPYAVPCLMLLNWVAFKTAGGVA